MNRRCLLKRVAALPFLTTTATFAKVLPAAARAGRVRPSDPAWPKAPEWEALNRAVGGNLLQPRTIWQTCAQAPHAQDCLARLKEARNPIALGDDPGGTQISGWLDAWTSNASAYAVAARSTADVVAGVNFARQHNLRLVVKGGGHSYLGGSNAPDSLLIWTRAMNRIDLHDAFVPVDCSTPPTPAVTVEAGCMWIDVYTAVTNQAGRYVQGGGCTTVGVAGLVLGGGFGSFSKRFGLAAASLLQAEVVTADGVVRTVNASREPDLFWALKGGGGGSFGVVTRITLQTHDLPESFGWAGFKIKASSREAYRRLVRRLVDHYADNLFNPHWGERFIFQNDEIHVAMVCQGLNDHEAKSAWVSFIDWVRASPKAFTLNEEPHVGAGPSRHWWDLEANPGLVPDPRDKAAHNHGWWRGDGDQASVFLHAYESQWLPASLLEPAQRGRLVDALVAAAQFQAVELHFNKGLAGAPPEVNEQASQCAMNPKVADAFGLVIIATGGAPPFAGLPITPPDMAQAHRNAENVAKAAAVLKALSPQSGSYISETDFFREDWREAFWGTNYARLKSIKDRYDPEGFFFVHHGVGSEDWSPDGFTPVRS
ncbi:FAD linked oxidase domain-containing protein [Paraburkholderia ribeironis]|uniref:FAD linked oxidase domain-containing protein n=1 Tax=Paraburkholderia ribeironis TaxID=1247936 RepID=A0A1N7SBH2_9BURK|nr:FAD-binding oxidoreductase [Paraburkholderia ribeironis]SIT44747.1 FAD linked oxidase domain-containing protein [Paraburkholderia ribeironis]